MNRFKTQISEIPQHRPSWNKVTSTVTDYEKNRAVVDAKVAELKKKKEAERKKALYDRMKSSAGSVASQQKPVTSEEAENISETENKPRQLTPFDQERNRLRMQIRNLTNVMKNLRSNHSPSAMVRAKEIQIQLIKLREKLRQIHSA